MREMSTSLRGEEVVELDAPGPDGFAGEGKTPFQLFIDPAQKSTGYRRFRP